MKAIKYFLVNLFTLIVLISCSSNPNDPTDPCTNKKIIGFSLDDYPTTNTIRQADLTFGEFNGNGFINTVPPSQLITIGRISPNDANAYNPNTSIYSFLMTHTNTIINFDENNNVISEVNLPTGNTYAGLVYSNITNKYYTLQVSSTNIDLKEITSITTSPITFSPISVNIYSGADANDAVFYQSYIGIVTDNNGTLYILTNKDIIEVDVANFSNSTTPVYHSLNNTFNSATKFTGIEFDTNNNRLLFTEYSIGATVFKLRKTNLPIANAYGNTVIDLSTYYNNFNLEFNSTALACDGSYIISNHIDNQPQIETKFIIIEPTTNISIATVPTHIFGLQFTN